MAQVLLSVRECHPNLTGTDKRIKTSTQSASGLPVLPRDHRLSGVDEGSGQPLNPLPTFSEGRIEVFLIEPGQAATGAIFGRFGFRLRGRLRIPSPR